VKQPLSEEAVQILEAIAGTLLRCFLFLVVAQLFVWVVFFLAGDAIYQFHAMLFDIPRPAYDLFILSSLTFMKILNVVFFLVPFVALKLMLRGERKSE